MRSVVNQTYKDFEVIAVDNNCTDKTIEIVREEFSQLVDIKIVECKEKGIEPALNMGLKYSSGEWLARQDGDDYWYPEKLEKQMTFLKENPDVDILGTQIRLLNERGQVEKEGTFGAPVNYPTDSNTIKTMLLMGQNPICHPSVVFKKRVVQIIGGYEMIFPLAEDLHFWLKAVPHFSFSNIDEILVDYTQKKNPSYNPAVPLLAADHYYSLYKRAGLIQGEREERVYDWQAAPGGYKHG